MEFSNSQIETWPITKPKFAKNEIEINNGLVKMLQNASVPELIAAYTYVTPDDIRNLFQIDRSVFGSFSGSGIDLGGDRLCIVSSLYISSRCQSFLS